MRSPYIRRGADYGQRRTACRDLLRYAFGDEPLPELRLGLNQDQPIGDDRFICSIEVRTSPRRQLRTHRRSRKRDDQQSAGNEGQGELPV